MGEPSELITNFLMRQNFLRHSARVGLCLLLGLAISGGLSMLAGFTNSAVAGLVLGLLLTLFVYSPMLISSLFRMAFPSDGHRSDVGKKKRLGSWIVILALNLGLSWFLIVLLSKGQVTGLNAVLPIFGTSLFLCVFFSIPMLMIRLKRTDAAVAKDAAANSSNKLR